MILLKDSMFDILVVLILILYNSNVNCSNVWFGVNEEVSAKLENIPSQRASYRPSYRPGRKGKSVQPLAKMCFHVLHYMIL